MKWISVDERLPKKPSWNLICHEGNRFPMGNPSRWFNGKKFEDDTGMYAITHWMPLPAPPESSRDG